MKVQEAHQYLLEQAKALGIDAEIVASEERELSLESFNGSLSQITQATQGGIGLRVVINGKTGYASSEEVTQEALDWILLEAKENAELQSETGGFITKGQAFGYKDLIGEGLSGELEDKANAALELERQLRADSRIQQIPMNRYSERENQFSLSSTQGAQGGYRNGVSFLMASMIMQEGKSLKQSYGFQVEKDFHALEPGTTAQAIITDTARMLGASPLRTGRQTAYFEPKAVAQLMGLILFMLNGKTVAEGKSRFADKLGERVASEQVSFIDNPVLEGGKANRPFDSEGTPAKSVSLIEQGILKSFLHNSQTAQQTKQTNTGHASRSYKGTLGIAPSNFYLKEGSGVAVSNGIIISEMMGVHAGANPISGDFSLQAFGLEVKDNEAPKPVENFAISGNLLELLQNITAVGDTLKWYPFGGMMGAPMIEVRDLSFAGE